MKHRLLVGALTLLLSATLLSTPLSARTRAPAGGVSPHYYLALGDSLSVGYQPDRAGVGTETDQGYVNDVYASAARRVRNLTLVQLGCPGETTNSMISGSGNPAAPLFHCDRHGGSQLSAALAFLRSHAATGEVPLITVDIGANDVDSCISDLNAGLGPVQTCVEKGVARLEANTPRILAALHRAAPRGTFLAAMNLYDPILAEALSKDPVARGLAALSISLVRIINADIARADSAHGFVTADVAAAFGTYDRRLESTTGTVLATRGVRRVPSDVADICHLTWMCAPAPRGPNIHANRAGYAAIARSFAAVL